MNPATWGGIHNSAFENGLLLRVDRDSALILGPFELDDAVDEGKNSVIVADANADAGMELSAALANDNGARLYDLAAVLLNAEPLCVRISAVSR